MVLRVYLEEQKIQVSQDQSSGEEKQIPASRGFHREYLAIFSNSYFARGWHGGNKAGLISFFTSLSNINACLLFLGTYHSYQYSYI